MQIVINLFSLSEESSETSLGKSSELDDSPVEGAQSIVSCLPYQKFHDIWDSLIYEDQLQFKLLHFLCRMCRWMNFLFLVMVEILSSSSGTF